MGNNRYKRTNLIFEIVQPLLCNICTVLSGTHVV